MSFVFVTAIVSIDVEPDKIIVVLDGVILEALAIVSAVNQSIPASDFT